MSAYRQKRTAMVNDSSGYDRCSLIVTIPILSAIKIQCCPIPTSILSNHTGSSVYFFDDYTEGMGELIHKWKELGLTFDDIINSFLGSETQIEIIIDITRQFGQEDTRVIIGPITGDHRETYATYTPAICSCIKELVSMGDIVIPSLTGVCILTGRTYRKDRWSRKELGQLVEEIQIMGPKYVVITGVDQGGYIMDVVTEGEWTTFPRTRRTGHERPKTGNIFSSVVSAAAIRGRDLDSAARLTVSLVKVCIARPEELDIPIANGVYFGELVGVLVHTVDRKHEAGKSVRAVDSRCKAEQQARDGTG